VKAGYIVQNLFHSDTGKHIFLRSTNARAFGGTLTVKSVTASIEARIPHLAAALLIATLASQLLRSMISTDNLPTPLIALASPTTLRSSSTHALLAIARPAAGRGVRSVDCHPPAGPHLAFISVVLKPEQEVRVVVSRQLLLQITPYLRRSWVRTVAGVSW
jgi:hypothetical protein